MIMKNLYGLCIQNYSKFMRLFIIISRGTHYISTLYQCLKTKRKAKKHRVVYNSDYLLHAELKEYDQ